MAEEVINGKRKEIRLNERGLKNIDGLKGITAINYLYLHFNKL